MGHCHARSQVSSQRLVLSACADSFCALTGLVEHYAQGGDTPVTQAWIVLLVASGCEAVVHAPLRAIAL
jgi:hypothetical protein